MNNESTKNGRSIWELIKYFFSFKERDINRRKEFQKKLDQMDTTQLSAELSRAEESYNIVSGIYKLLKSISIVSLMSLVITILAKIGKDYFLQMKITKSSMTLKDLQLSSLVAIIIFLLIFLCLVVILLTTNSILAKTKTKRDIIKEAFNLKKSIHEKNLEKQEEKKIKL